MTKPVVAQRAGRLLRVTLITGSLLFLLFLMTAMRSNASEVFTSPVSTPTSPVNSFYWGLHLGNHVNGEPWTEALLKHIDGDEPDGIWPRTLVFPSFNLYTINRNTSGDCKISSVTGKYDLMTGAGSPNGYLQRASAAGVKIFIRIMPSPGNFYADHHLSLLPSPTNSNRCNIWPQDGGMRSYDDIGDEIIKIHQWNASHGINETGFLPANEPNAEWYDFSGDVHRDNPDAWTEMDAYFTAVYTYVHAVLPYPAVSVFTPPMSQEAYAELKDINGCTIDHTLIGGGYGYEKMTKVFMTGMSNDGYAWNNYWNLGYEAWTTECRPDVTPHGHHVALWFPLQMINSMLTKPTIITEADVKSPMQTNNNLPTVANKDDQLGSTVATSIEQFEIAESAADDIAVWALNITNPDEIEQNWHEGYACNDLNWVTGTSKGPALERPWFTLWWTGESSALSFAPCYKIYLSAALKNYADELIVNGHFDTGDTAGWTYTRNISCNSPIVATFSGNPAARLAHCNENVDQLYQTVTIPTDVATATLTYRFQVEANGGFTNDEMKVKVRNSAGQDLATLATYTDAYLPPNIWQNATYNLSAYSGQTIQVYFTALNRAVGPTKFWVDDVSLRVTFP